jgi:uncharacterized membrane protein YfcA
MLVIAFCATGLAAGFLAGLMGVGGGVVIVPALVWVFASEGFAPHALMHLAIGTSLMTIVATASAAAAAHHRRGAVRGRVLAGLAPGLLLGAALGGQLARQIPTTSLRFVFACFLLFVSLRLLWGGQPQASNRSPPTAIQVLVGATIGAVSALVGIGGGTLTVPYLVWSGLPLRQAVGTSASAAIPLALSGAASFALAGWNVGGLPEASSGYIYWPAFAALAPAAVLMAPLGARLAHRLPTAVLRRSFGALVLLIAVKMMLGLAG